MSVFIQLVTRPQYYIETVGPEGGEYTKYTKIPGACRVEEENEHRLLLAERLLAQAVSVLTYEMAADAADAQAALEEAPTGRPN